MRTEIRRLDRFWPAEDGHQKYALRCDAALLALVRPFCPGEAALRDSPLAAKMNAYAAGDLSFAALREQCAALGFAVDGDGGRPVAIRAAAPAAPAAPSAAAATR